MAKKEILVFLLALIVLFSGCVSLDKRYIPPEKVDVVENTF